MAVAVAEKDESGEQEWQAECQDENAGVEGDMGGVVSADPLVRNHLEGVRQVEQGHGARHQPG